MMTYLTLTDRRSLRDTAEELCQKGVGVIAMKVPAYGRLFKPGVLDGMHHCFCNRRIERLVNNDAFVVEVR